MKRWFTRGMLPLCILLGSLLALACSGKEILRPLCSSNQECIDAHNGNPNWICFDRGQCACTNDDACAENEHCNPIPAGDGECVPDGLCSLNTDCSGGQICGRDGICHNGCKSDLECRIGQVCNVLAQLCTDGCYTGGDCPLHQACTCADQPGGFCTCDAADQKAACEIGSCKPGICPDSTYCDYGEICMPDEMGIRRCSEDTRGPYCEKCTVPAGDPYARCDSLGPNFCLIDPNDPARIANYCGVDCSQGQECPNGYYCRDVLRLTSAACTASTQCVPPGSAPECLTTDDCSAGSVCSAGGHCAGTCVLREGAFRGYCSCVSDDECPQDVCGSDGYCSVSRQPCFPGTKDPCRGYVRCVNDGTKGYCRIGRNCTPAGGLSCGEILRGGPP